MKKRVRTIENKHHLPSWAIDPFMQFCHDVDDLSNYIDLISTSINITTGLPRVVKALDGYSQLIKKDEISKEKKIRLNKISRLASKEKNNNFPFIFNQASILLYSYLESLIKELIIQYIKNNKSYLKIKEFSNIKIALADYEILNVDEKYDYIFMQYEKNIATGLVYGVNRFEALLTPIKLAGPVKKETQKNIFELAQIRNALLHKGGKADRTLIERCSWLKLKRNQKIQVTKEDYRKYNNSSFVYIMTVFHRYEGFFKIDMSKMK